MKNRLVILLSLLITIQSSIVLGQSQEIGDLKLAIEKMPDDSAKVNKIIDLCNILRNSNLSEALEYSDLALNVSKGINYSRGSARSNLSLGYIYIDLADYEKASNYFYKALEISEKNNDQLYVAKTNNALGQQYHHQGKYDKALKYYFNSLEIMDDLDDKQGMSEAINNIGIIYFSQGDYEKTLEYFFRDLNLSIKNKDQDGIANSYNNIGYVYLYKEEIDSALKYQQKALEIRKEQKNNRGIALAYINIGNIYEDDSNYNEALMHFNNALEIIDAGDDVKRKANLQLNIGETYFYLKDYKSAIDYLNSALKIAEEIKEYEYIRDIYSVLAKIYDRLGQYNLAYEYQKLNTDYIDSTHKHEASQELARLENKYEIGKKEKEIALKESEITLQEEKVQRQRVLIFIFIGVFIIIILFTMMVLRLNRRVKQKNILLADQKEEIMLQNDSLELLNNELAQQKEEVTAQRDEIEKKNVRLSEANNLIESKNKNITASIRYAQRIQQAILPSDKFIKTFLPDSFVLFLPKDIVSGDFYWIDVTESKIFFSAVDCTGHGVLGAFMSILARNILTQAVNEERIEKPSEVLNYASMTINKILRQKSEDKSVKDGMDLGLCVINRNKMLLEFAGANNPVVIVRNKEVIQMKGDKYPIGEPFTEKFKSYTNQVFHLEKGDVIYTFSDGYHDQFGGPKNKKFLTKRLREKFAEISGQSMGKQKQELVNTFNEWKGNREQIDDVCIIGVRV